MNLVMFGPPGSGKGTQSERLVRHFSLTHISTGDALRAAIRAKTEVGKKAQALIERGELVGDEVVSELLASIIAPLRSKTDSFLFDGFPRTLPQVHRLEALCEEYRLQEPSVMNLIVPDELLVKRLTGRRICADCRATFNVYYSPTRQAGVCDHCAGPLTRRIDDHSDTVRERLRVYHAQTAPVLSLYQEKGVLYNIDATDSADSVFEKITRVIEQSY